MRERGSVREEVGAAWEEAAPGPMPLMDRQVLALLHRILARVLPEGSCDIDGDDEYQLERARVLEAGTSVGTGWRRPASVRIFLIARIGELVHHHAADGS
jgi:hypothetical protein